MDKYPLNVFSRYVEGNKSALTGIGVIATITALFLNLDQSIFGESLRNLQLLLLLFLSFYLPNVFLGFYSDFAHGKELSAIQFLESLYKPFAWSFAVWVAIAEFCVSFFFTKERARLWLNILLLSLLGVSLLAILWPVILDLICVFKTSC